MTKDVNEERGSRRRLAVLTRDGRPVTTDTYDDPAESIAHDHQQIQRLMDRAKNAQPGDDTPYGYIAFMCRRHISRMQDVMEAQHEGVHRSGWVEDVDGVDCTGCVCGVLVPGRVGRDFTEAEFQDAEGHLPFHEPEQDPRTCPRFGRGLPNDREPGSRQGFWSLTVQRGYVCDGCHDHQMHLG